MRVATNLVATLNARLDGGTRRAREIAWRQKAAMKAAVGFCPLLPFSFRAVKNSLPEDPPHLSIHKNGSIYYYHHVYFSSLAFDPDTTPRQPSSIGPGDPSVLL